MPENESTSDVSALTVQLLSAYLANNTIPAGELAELIRTTKVALTQDAAAVAEVAEAETFTPAVSARKSLASPEHIISLIDGKPYKTLKRHLASRGLTPETYRARYNLPSNYPMVAPAYADHRREVAQQFGLGRKGPKVSVAEQQDFPATKNLPEATELVDAEAGPVATETVLAPRKAAKAGSRKSKPVVTRQEDAGEGAPSPAGIPDAAVSNGDDSPTEATSTPPIAKRASAGKSRSTSGGPARGKVASAASSGAGADGVSEEAADAPAAKPSKRRGKTEPTKDTSEADGTQNPAGQVQAGHAEAAGGDKPSTAQKAKARPPKRMARTAK